MVEMRRKQTPEMQFRNLGKNIKEPIFVYYSPLSSQRTNMVPCVGRNPTSCSIPLSWYN